MNYPFPPNRVNFLDEVRNFFRSRSALSNLILINLIIWAVIQVLKVVAFFLNDPQGSLVDSLVMHTLALPASLSVLRTMIWSLLTYNFLHIELIHILFNMIWLFWFGKIFLEFLKPAQLVWVYLLGGISGGLVFVTAFNIFPVFSEILPVSYALGASASVMAIVTAISFYVPAYSLNILFIGRVRIGILALILFISDFFSIPSGNAGGHIAHIGGALFGFLYTLLFTGKSSLSWFSGNSGLFSQIKRWSAGSKKTRKEEFSNKKPLSDDEYNLNRKNQQRKIDSILEKISKGGYESLTREEKDFLFRSSKKQ